MSEIRFVGEKRFNWQHIVISVVILLMVVSLAAISALLWETRDAEPKIDVSDAKTKPIGFTLDSGTVYSHALTDNKIFFFSVDNLKISSAEGVLEYDMPLKSSNPIISTDGTYALVADKGGKTAHVFKDSKLEKTLTLDENIIIARINSNGYSLFITEGDVHKNSAIVRSATGEELFKWKSGSITVLSADISDNNRDIAISTISTDNGVVSSNIYMFNITKDKPFTNDIVSDEIFASVEFDGNYLYCIGCSKTLVYNSYGKCIETIDYEDRELISYEIDNGTILLLFSDSSQNSNGSLIRSYSTKGAFEGEFALSSKARFLDSMGGTIAVDNNRVVSILDSRCREKYQLNLGTTLSDFKFVGTSSKAVGITATGAEIVEVKNNG